MDYNQSDSIYRIENYSVKISREDSIIFKLTNIKGSLFPQEFLEFLKSSGMQGDEIIFHDIDTLIYGQERRLLKGTYNLIVK